MPTATRWFHHVGTEDTEDTEDTLIQAFFLRDLRASVVNLVFALHLRNRAAQSEKARNLIDGAVPAEKLKGEFPSIALPIRPPGGRVSSFGFQVSR